MAEVSAAVVEEGLSVALRRILHSEGGTVDEVKVSRLGETGHGTIYNLSCGSLGDCGGGMNSLKRLEREGVVLWVKPGDVRN